LKKINTKQEKKLKKARKKRQENTIRKKRRRTTAYTVPVAVLTSLTFKVIQSQ